VSKANRIRVVPKLTLAVQKLISSTIEANEQLFDGYHFHFSSTLHSAVVSLAFKIMSGGGYDVVVDVDDEVRLHPVPNFRAIN